MGLADLQPHSSNVRNGRLQMTAQQAGRIGNTTGTQHLAIPRP